MVKQWVQFTIGFWIMISPWLFGFSEISLAKWSNVIFGLIIILVNIWALVEKPRKV